MKILNASSITALLAGGSIALMPLNNLTETLIAVAIAFITLNTITYLTRSKGEN
jgi:hypothetical protein